MARWFEPRTQLIHFQLYELWCCDQNTRQTSTIFRCHYLLSFRVFETFISSFRSYSQCFGHYSLVAIACYRSLFSFSLARSLILYISLISHWFEHPKNFFVYHINACTKWKTENFTLILLHSKFCLFGACVPISGEQPSFHKLNTYMVSARRKYNHLPQQQTPTTRVFCSH